MDELSSFLTGRALHSRVFYNGAFCASNDFVVNDGGHLHFVRSGSVRFEHKDGSTIVVSVPTLVFYPRGLDYRLVVAPETSAVLLCASVQFQGRDDNLLARALPSRVHIAVEDAVPLHRTLDLLFAEASVAEFGQDIILDSLFDVLIAQIVRLLFGRATTSPGLLAGLLDPRLSRVLMAIHGCSKTPWRVESLACVAGMSRSRFALHFHATVGMTPMQYLTRWRMTVAQDLLRSGNSVKAVSEAVGYSSQPAFTRAFTEHSGFSPRQWLGSSKQLNS